MSAWRFVRYFIILNSYYASLVVCHENILNNLATHQNYSTVTCIYHILTKYFPCGTLTTFVNPNANVDQLIQDANDDNICYSIIVRSFDDRNWFLWANVYIITAEDLFELWSGMLDLTRDVFWNPRAKFIVELNNLNDMEGIKELFKIMLKYKIYNVILLHIGENDATIYTYNPFHNNYCGKRFDEVVNIGTCENAAIIKDYFTDNVSKDLKTCNIKVVASDDIPNFMSEASNYTVNGKLMPGLEQYVLDTIAAHEGFSIDYEVFNDDEIYYGIVLPNRTSTGLLSYLDRDKADVAAGGFVLMKNRVELFDYLYGFNYASYNVFTPAIESLIWKRLYREFGILTWSLIFGSLVSVIVVCLIFKRLLQDNTCSILNVWGYFFGNANAGISRNINYRIIILSWSWFTFFIGSFYNTALFSLTSVHVHETQHSISTENLKSLPYKPCISENSRMFFQFAFNQIFPEGEPIQNCTYTDGALHYVAASEKYYAIEMEYSYTLNENEYIDEDGDHSSLESWSFSSNNVVVIYLVRGFPFKNKFQTYATRMFEAGLIKNHLKTIHQKNFNAIGRHPKTFQNITIPDLRIHFFILLSGYVLSCTCFLLELWYNNVTREEQLKRRTRRK